MENPDTPETQQSRKEDLRDALLVAALFAVMAAVELRVGIQMLLDRIGILPYRPEDYDH